MKRIVAFTAAFLFVLYAAICAFGMDENYALDYLQWSANDGVEVVQFSQSGMEGYVKYYVDDAEKSVYFYMSYTAVDFLETDNVVFLNVSVNNGSQSGSFSFDENGFTGYSGSDFELAQSFGSATKYGQDIAFAVHFLNSNYLTENTLRVSVSVNSSIYDVLNTKIILHNPSTTVAAKGSQSTTKATTLAATASKTTTKAANGSKTSKENETKFVPPADANYFTESTTLQNSIADATGEYEAQQFVEVPEPEEQFELSNSAKILIACAAVLALTGTGLIVKAVISRKNSKPPKNPQVKEPKIDKQSKEIIDRYIDDDYDIEE